MKIDHSRFINILAGTLGVCLCATLPAQAQGQAQRPAAASSSTTASRPYVPNGTIGDAVISSDPDTKQITVIADDETAQYIKQVIRGLDRPKPQVLIKVVYSWKLNTTTVPISASRATSRANSGGQ